MVDGKAITAEDFRYSLQIAHRREDLSSAGELSLSEYVQKLIDDTLIIEEARRMGLDRSPEVRKAVDAFILRESVVKLYADEVSGKVSVSDDDVMNYYKKNYESFTLGIIETDSKEEAEEVLKQLDEGADFRDLARKYSTSGTGSNGGDIVLRRGSMPPHMGEAVAALDPGGVSDVIMAGGKYYVVKLYGRTEAPEGELPGIRRQVEKAVRKQKEKIRADEYLEVLRRRSSIKVDRELLSAIATGKDDEDAGKWAESEDVVAEVDGSVLTAGEFVTMAETYKGRPKEYVLNSWIDRKVVDHEALRRNYLNDPDFKKRVERYEDQLLKRTFIDKVIVPRIKVTEEILREYYSEHLKEFSKPDRFRIQQITVGSLDEAREISESLNDGADFSWLARKRSTDGAGPKGGDAGWLVLEELPGPARRMVLEMEPGEISPVFEVGSSYRIIRLLAKAEGEPMRFEDVRDAVLKAYFRDELKRRMDLVVSKLREDARIEVYWEAVRSIEKEIGKR
ncbi:MAG: hypothetical protein GXO94_01950 [Nitrospirae bacterium]|nr:hypothetical protein [Nitrospirota bacterium]